jgi:DNA-directed RNA polymerase subunit beta
MNGELDLSFSINVNNPAVTVGNKDLKKQPTGLEKILVFENNNNLSPQLVVPIIAPNVPATSTSLLLTDLISIASYTIGLQYNIGEIDIIEHIGNKRLRLIHEQLKAKLNIGLMKVEKHIKEKLSQIYSKTATGEQKEKNERKATVKNIVNTKEFQKAIHAFFNTYSLTQFVDQQNPLSELSAKRKISAMGDGGISRDDPNLEVRDIHYSQFGRICPIESPEGMSIGLIMSLAGYTKIDDNGFLLSPYFKVNNGVITKDVE